MSGTHTGAGIYNIKKYINCITSLVKRKQVHLIIILGVRSSDIRRPIFGKRCLGGNRACARKRPRPHHRHTTTVVGGSGHKSMSLARRGISLLNVTTRPRGPGFQTPRTRPRRPRSRDEIVLGSNPGRRTLPHPHDPRLTDIPL